jgi:ribosomal protein S18 acetylase RimI-like enzyme
MMFIARPANAADLDLTARVIDHAVRAVDPQSTAMVQALVDVAEDLQLAAIKNAAFEELAILAYMQRSISPQMPAPKENGRITLQPWREDLRPRFLEALEASYQQTLDCPALHGIRKTTDVLEGHMATGEFEADLWTLATEGDRVAGVMLLNPVPAQGCVELVYLGLAPAYRKRGLATQLMQRGLWQCAQRGHRTLTLAVDERNTPAVRLYESFDFHCSMRKIALMRQIPQPTE